MLKNFEGCGIEVKVIRDGEVITWTVALAQLNKGYNYEIEFEDGKMKTIRYPELVWVDGKGHYMTGSFYSGGKTGVGKNTWEQMNDIIDEDIKILETNPIEALRKFEISKEERQARIEYIRANDKKKQEEAIMLINSRPDYYPVKSHLEDESLEVMVVREEAYGAIGRAQFPKGIDCDVFAEIDGSRIWINEFFTEKGNLRRKNIDASLSRFGQGERLYQTVKNLKAKMDEVKADIREIANR